MVTEKFCPFCALPIEPGKALEHIKTECENPPPDEVIKKSIENMNTAFSALLTKRTNSREFKEAQKFLKPFLDRIFEE